MLKLAWRAAPEDPSCLDSTVTFRLEPEGSGTRLFIDHDGFDLSDPYQAASCRILGTGWPAMPGNISAVLGEEGQEEGQEEG
jgi:uncharacterized protein YndB with AHSA1/START domain